MNLTVFLSGACMTAFWAAGVFFIKFWKTGRDRFFLFFGIASLLIALERVALLFVNGPSFVVDTRAEVVIWVYLVRLLAFILILFAIIEKNRSTKSRF